MLDIRAMVSSDIPLGMRLKDRAGWNQTPADWRRFLALEPEGCFLAQWNGQPVGTTTTCILGDIGWIAMVLVDEPARHQGIGTGLVRHAVDYLQRRRVSAVRLDATAFGRPVYERLGFAVEYELDRLAGEARSTERRECTVVPARVEDAGSLAMLDEQTTGTQRRRLLERLLEENPESTGMIVEDLGVQGYVMHRAGSRRTFIGPAVARTPDVGRALLDWAMGRCSGQSVCVDIPCLNGEAIQWASSQGLVSQRRFSRMCLGPRVRERPEQLWASSGPEKG